MIRYYEIKLYFTLESTAKALMISTGSPDQHYRYFEAQRTTTLSEKKKLKQRRSASRSVRWNEKKPSKEVELPSEIIGVIFILMDQSMVVDVRGERSNARAPG